MLIQQCVPKVAKTTEPTEVSKGVFANCKIDPENDKSIIHTNALSGH